METPRQKLDREWEEVFVAAKNANRNVLTSAYALLAIAVAIRGLWPEEAVAAAPTAPTDESDFRPPVSQGDGG